MNNTFERARSGLMAMLGFGLDAKRRNAWAEYGYVEKLTAKDFFKAYSRHGLAFGAVSKLHGACWISDPWVIDGEKQDEKRNETAWERAVKAALPDDFWHQIAETDRRRLVGRYAGLVLLIADSKKLSDPVAGTKNTLEGLQPVWQNSLKVAERDVDTGKPTMYQYAESYEGISEKWVDVHADRVVIFGDMASDAVGFLEPGYNNIVNLEKIEGGSGESFLKNASRQPHINFDKDVNLTNLAKLVGANDVAGIQAKVDEVARGLAEGIDKTLVTQGATANMLVATVPDPNPHYTINVQTASAAYDIPAKILVGNQNGERASTEDQKYWASRCQSRRERTLSREIKGVIRHLQRIGVLPALAVLTVMWDDLRTPTRTEKLGDAKIMADINVSTQATGAPVFQDDEIRSTAGFESKKDAGTNTAA